MNLEWKEHSETGTGGNAETLVHYSEVNQCEEHLVKTAVEDTIDKSLSLLPQNILDDSLFLLFEWDVECSTLVVVVTDHNKECDSPETVKCCFNVEGDGEQRIEKGAFAEKVEHWIRDYLTTCARFMNFSLVAAFHSNNRSSTVML